MILIDSTKFTVDGVDVYPDHASPFQFWYVPGLIRLAERNGRKALSYFWYTDSATDSEGTGFLNFEVNTAVPPATLDRIRAEVARRTGRDAGKLVLSTVTFTKGAVNLSALGPTAAQAVRTPDDPSVLYQSKEQVVWSAGSSSLVGDNTAVCSIQFTKEGRLASAMKSAILAGANTIAALYRLEFLAMRPSVTFKVHGTLEKTVRDFQASLGGEVPLEALILDLGINAQWQRILQNTDLKIEVIDFGGDNDKEGLKWAQQILLDYILKNFFETQIGSDPNNWSPLKEAPKVSEAVEKARGTEEAAADKAASDGKVGEEADTAVKEIVKAATLFIPKVNIRAAYYDGRQENKIDFLYSELKARPYQVLPQALVLEGLGEPASYITQINRSQDPFGQPYPVNVALPDAADFTALGLTALNIQARYPANAPASSQAVQNFSITDGKRHGTEPPFRFQYDAKGSADVAFTVDYVFRSGGDWVGETTRFSVSGRAERGLIVATPDAAVQFVTLDIRLDTDFVWEDADEVKVTLTSAKWKGTKQVTFQNGQADPRILRIRSGIETAAAEIRYTVDVHKGGKRIYGSEAATVQDDRIVVRDRFGGHTPVFFTASFDDDSVDITLSHTDGAFAWEDQFTLEKGQKRLRRIVPTLADPKPKSDLRFTYEVLPMDGEPFSKTGRGGQTIAIKLPGA